MVRIPLFLSSLESGSVRPLIYGKTAKSLFLHYTIARKAQLLKWKVSKKQKLEKILPLDDVILAKLAVEEKVSEEEVVEEIEKSCRLKADATQRLPAIKE